MKRLILLRGVPGAGKSDFADFLVDIMGLEDTLTVATDDYMIDYQGNYEFKPEKLGLAHDMVRQDVRDAMSAGVFTIIVHNTLTREAEVRPFIEMAEEFGYKVTSLVVENRHGSDSVHGVPEKTRRNMAERFSLSLVPYGTQQVGKIQEKVE